MVTALQCESCYYCISDESSDDKEDETPNLVDMCNGYVEWTGYLNLEELVSSYHEHIQGKVLEVIT